MPSKVCLVTIAIGDKYLQQYNTLFRKSQETYAKKHGYDFKVIPDYIDKTIKHPHTVSLNKILVCSCPWSKEYEYVIFVDADILINPNSPPIDFSTLGNRIGCVSQNQPDLQARLLLQEFRGYERTAKDYYKLKSDHDIETDYIINTGVLVLQPNKHRKVLEEIYYRYVNKQINNKNGFHFEQSVIGYELQKKKLDCLIDMKWNALWANNKIYYNDIKKQPLTLQDFFDQNYFIHFAGNFEYNLIPTLTF